LFLFVSFLFASSFGCSPYLVSTNIQTTSSPNPNLTSLAELAATQEQTLTRSPLPTILPTDSLTLEVQKSNTPSPSAVPTRPLPTVVLSDEMVREMLSKVSIDRALNDLRRLTGESPICLDSQCYTITDRETESEGLRWAKEYVYRELASLGYSVELKEWSRDGLTDQNLIARKTGLISPEEEIYFVAHLDGVESGPAADDDASGVVDILELARILNSFSLSRTVVLFISTGEEHGALGVQSYVNQLSAEELGAIKYVVNIDMVGYDADGDGAMQLWSGDHPPSLLLAEELSQMIQTYPIDLEPDIITGCN
jgi:hypothetical protein